MYDVQELYRWLIDLSVIQLLEEKKLKKADFIVTESYNIRLRENTAKALIDKIKLNFNARALYNGKYYSYQNILYENIRLLANYIMGKSGKLQFNVPEFKIKRDDNTDVRSKVLSLTPEDRKKLGIIITIYCIKHTLTNMFLPYYLHPETVGYLYSVAITQFL